MIRALSRLRLRPFRSSSADPYVVKYAKTHTAALRETQAECILRGELFEADQCARAIQAIEDIVARAGER